MKIYLDNNATTPIDPQVLQAMLDVFALGPTNPSSVHAYGRTARNLLTKAQRFVAGHFNVSAKEVIFTSGGTEAMNLALRSRLTQKPGHIVTATTEHACVLATLQQFPNIPVTLLEPGIHGAPTPSQLEQAIRSDTTLIVLMAANNETGVLTDLDGIARVAEQANIPLLVDGVGELGKSTRPLPAGVSAIAFSGHKIHAPKGVGLLLARRSFTLSPQITGGSQQYGRRAGTENVAAIVAFAKALELLHPSHIAHMQRLRDQLEAGICALYPQASINGTGPRLCNTTNVAFTGADGEALLMNLDLANIAVSHGSACSSGSLEPSHVLLGMGLDRARARSSIRFSVSRLNTIQEIEQTLEQLKIALKRNF